MFSWVVEGKVDVVADMRLPVNIQEIDLRKIVEGVRENIETLALNNGNGNHDDEDVETLYAPRQTSPQDDDGERVVFDIMVTLNDVRAQVPYLTHDLSYVNNAFIRPIVAYINSRRTHIPVRCQVVKPLEDFDGSWGLWDSGLMDAVSAEVILSHEELTSGVSSLCIKRCGSRDTTTKNEENRPMESSARRPSPNDVPSRRCSDCIITMNPSRK
jgi:hypothetical protein